MSVSSIDQKWKEKDLFALTGGNAKIIMSLLLTQWIFDQAGGEGARMAVPYSRYVVGSLPWYGFLIVLGAAFAIWLAGREEKVAGLPKDTFVDLALRVLPIGILGARLYYVAFSWDAYREDPLSILYIWNGGLAIYGGLIAGFLTILFFCRKRKLPLSRVCDALIPGVAFARRSSRSLLFPAGHPD